jgi:metal-responsive CopG/Arc/MetJ family transcriptional regulator
MKSVLVQLDDATSRALSRTVPPGSRRRAEFIREAIRKALREAELERIRLAYQAQPDAESEADDWSGAEEYRR